MKAHNRLKVCAAAVLLTIAGISQAQPQANRPITIPRDIGIHIPLPQPRPHAFRGDVAIHDFYVNPDQCTGENEFRAVKLDGIIVSGPVTVEVGFNSADRWAHPVRAQVSLTYLDRYFGKRRVVKKQVTLNPRYHSGVVTVRFNPPRVISFRSGITARIRVLDTTFTDTNPGNNSMTQAGRRYCKVPLY